MNLKRVGRSARSVLLARLSMPWSTGHPASRRMGGESAGGKGSGSRTPGVRGMLWRGEKSPREHRPLRASARSGTDLRREQRPGAAGHRDLLVLRARERDARNGKRATAPQGVRLCGGEKLCRANPMSGTGPRGRTARKGANRQESEKLWRRNVPGLEARVGGPSVLMSL
jgi:hypothetical protein